MGAVWGSKKLKAIYVAGTGKITPANPDGLKALRKKLKRVYEESIFIAMWVSFQEIFPLKTGR